MSARRSTRKITGFDCQHYNDHGWDDLRLPLQAIDGAKASINFSVYIWEDGTVSDQVLDRLIRKQKPGRRRACPARRSWRKKSADDRFDALKKAGGHVQKVRMPKFGTWTRFHRRNHRRSIVIDGEIGFTGGMAVADQWLGYAQGPKY